MIDSKTPVDDSQEDWQRENLGHVEARLGGLSLTNAVTHPAPIDEHEAGAEAVYDRQGLLSLDNFMDAASESNTSKTIAKNAWNVLTRLFTLKDNPEPFRRYSWFREEGYDYVPIVFEHVPKKDPNGRYSSFQLTELRPETIRPLLETFDLQLEIAGHDQFIEVRDDILGTAASRSVIQFLRDIAESVEQDSATS